MTNQYLHKGVLYISAGTAQTLEKSVKICNYIKIFKTTKGGRMLELDM